MSVDNRTIINDCEANTGWTGDDSASTTTVAGLFFQNTTALTTQLSDSDEQMHTTQDSVGAGTFNVDWSDATLYMLIKDNLNDNLAGGGVQFVIGDGTDLIGYDVGGFDGGGMPLAKFFLTYKLDVSVIVASPGSFATYSGSEANLDQTAITQVGYGSLHLSKAQGASDNVVMDCFRYIANDSYALTINGGTSGTPETMADVVGDDEATAQGWGMCANPNDGQYTFIAPTEWGTPSGTADSYFTGTDEVWYWLGGAVGSTHFPFRVIGNSTGTNSLVLTRVTIVNTGTRAQLDLSNADMDFVQFDTCTLVNVGTITFPTANDADKFANITTFVNCDQITFGATDGDGCIFEGSNDPNGAVLWSTTPADVAFQDNFTFNSDGTGHGVHINLNTASLTTYNVDGYTETGYAASDGSTGNEFFLVDNALDGDVTINLTNATGNFSVMSAAGYTGTVTVNVAVNVDWEAVDKDDTAIQDVLVTAYAVDDDTEIINDTTDAQGEATVTYSGTTPRDIYYKYRKSSTGAQKYVNLSGFATILPVTGSFVKRSMRQDDIADPSI